MRILFALALLALSFFNQSLQAEDFNPRNCSIRYWVLIIDGTSTPDEVTSVLEVVNHGKTAIRIARKTTEGKTIIYNLEPNPSNGTSKRSLALEARVIESIIGITKRYPKTEFYCWSK